LKVTLDTNTFPLEQALAALRGKDADVAVTTVTTRELRGSDWENEALTLTQLPEVWVMGEGPLGVAALGDESMRDCFEAALKAISNGSFPRPGQRENLTDAERRQMRDAITFCTHLREGRDIFVTDDKKGFGTDGSEQRQRMLALGSTRIMTLGEFEVFCRTL
jgi:hypothetical protein